MSKARYLKRLATIEQQKTALLHRVEKLSGDTLNVRPTPDTWSILEIIEHMILAEHHVFRGLPALEAITHHKRTPVNYVVYLMVLGILRFHIPVAVPAKDMRPSGALTLTTLRERWDQNHQWLRAYLNSQSIQGLRRAVFTHPASGPMSTRQMFAMMEAHMDRHVDQINKRL
ncbi:MAG: DinB family protein [Bacteroidota bacterium]